MRNASVFFKIMSEKGISIIALMIFLLLTSVLALVFSSIMTTKQKSARLPYKSAQAFYLAEAGIEYAIRDAYDHELEFWADPANIFPVNKSLGAGSFNVTYDEQTKGITSTGTVGGAKRIIRLGSLFPCAYADNGDYPHTGNEVIILAKITSFLAGGVVTLEPKNIPYQGGPPFSGNQKNIYIPTLNDTEYEVHIFNISLANQGRKQARLNKIELGDTTVWTGNKVEVSENPDSPTPFPFNQVGYYTMDPGKLTDTITVQAQDEVSGTWYITFHYSKQTDLSKPDTSKAKFYMPLMNE